MPAPRRRLEDPSTIRALAHPLRLELLQLLMTRGPLTATEAGEAVGESPASASFHLRQLARFGYIEEAGGGTGRRRPWRIVQGVQELPTAELTGEAALAASEFDRVLAERANAMYDTWLRTRSSFPPEWQAATSETFAVVHLTVGQAAELRARLQAVFEDFLVYQQDALPGAMPMAYLSQVFPLAQP